MFHVRRRIEEEGLWDTNDKSILRLVERTQQRTQILFFYLLRCSSSSRRNSVVGNLLIPAVAAACGEQKQSRQRGLLLSIEQWF